MEPYDIAVDERRRVLRATLHGFWTLATTETYLAELAAAATRVARGGGASWWLIDTGESQVQSREVSALMGERLPSLFPPHATVAVVTSASLIAVQAKRVVPNEHHRHFSTRAAAQSWLTEQGMSG